MYVCIQPNTGFSVFVLPRRYLLRLCMHLPLASCRCPSCPEPPQQPASGAQRISCISRYRYRVYIFNRLCLDILACRSYTSCLVSLHAVHPVRAAYVSPAISSLAHLTNVSKYLCITSMKSIYLFISSFLINWQSPLLFF